MSFIMCHTVMSLYKFSSSIRYSSLYPLGFVFAGLFLVFFLIFFSTATALLYFFPLVCFLGFGNHQTSGMDLMICWLQCPI